ncbi:MAG: glutamate synthase central domain-containing protein, partial [Halorhabdus sp.]
MTTPTEPDGERGLTDGSAQRSNCGVGVLMNLDGEREHGIISEGLELLENLDHRGARGAEENTGDGAGILIQKPHAFFSEEVPALGDREFDDYGVGQVFFPKERSSEDLQAVVEAAADEEGFDVLAWRDVPTDNEGLGATALENEPDVVQFFVAPREDLAPDELDTALYVLRNVIETRVEDEQPTGADRFYVCSLDRRKLVYKGLLTNAQVRTYYEDLRDERLRTSLVFVHSRFSTNTLGAWDLAHPYRNIIHNGEINTLRGNLNWMQAREADLASPAFGEDIEKLKPITQEGQSDTAVVDNVLELLVEGGRSLPHALRMLVPEAWEESEYLAEDRKDFYRYHSTINEPWDGPALIAFTDGFSVGAILDRNGLRPCRYLVTEDDRLVMASETGAIEVDPANVRHKDRLEPGQMFYADAEEGRIVPDDEIFDSLTDAKYGEWLADNRVPIEDVRPGAVETPTYVEEDITKYQRAFGYTLDHVERLLEPMAEEGKDPIGAMGNDTPLSVLSNRNKQLFTYFKQLFAQVSNPPIDYIREETVTSLKQHVGRQNNLLAETPEHCRQLALDSPIL